MIDDSKVLNSQQSWVAGSSAIHPVGFAHSGF